MLRSQAEAAPNLPRRILITGYRLKPFAAFLFFLVALVLAAPAQQTHGAPVNSQPAGQQAPSASPASQSSPANSDPGSPPLSQAPEPKTGPKTGDDQSGSITEAELKQMLVGKFLYLRGGYLDDSLSFDEHGGFIGHSPQGSYTLSVIKIDRVHLTKHRVELEGLRYGLHFLGATPYEDPANAVDRVRITPKKKEVRITIDREIVIKHKKAKEKGKQEASKGAQPQANSPSISEPAGMTDAEQAQAQIAAAPPAERPADAASVTTTYSTAHATMVLKQALNNVFASSLDARMVAAMPEFWRLYYQAEDAGADFKPADPTVINDGAADRKAKLLTDIQAPSNEYAQQCGVAGVALYHAVIGPDGKPEEIAVARPIGFGLDENAVAAIRKAVFEPALKNGKPVPVLLDLIVEFRIYSKRTSVEASSNTPAKPTAPPLPGPYSVQH